MKYYLTPFNFLFVFSFHILFKPRFSKTYYVPG